MIPSDNLCIIPEFFRTHSEKVKHLMNLRTILAKIPKYSYVNLEAFSSFSWNIVIQKFCEKELKSEDKITAETKEVI